MKEERCTQLESGALRFVRDLPGPIERVWDYVIDPKKRGLWFAGGTMGEKPGDEFTWEFDHNAMSHETLPEKWAHLEGGITSHARVIAIEPPRLLVVLGIEDPQEIRFELRERGNRVEFTLIQGPPPEFKDLVSAAAGWQACLGLLIDNINGETPRGFWTTLEAAAIEYRETLKPAA